MVRVKKIIRQKGTGMEVKQLAGSATAPKGLKAQRQWVKETLSIINADPVRRRAAIHYRRIVRMDHQDWGRARLNLEVAKRYGQRGV